MDKPAVLFVDIQNDFMKPGSKLYVPGAEDIEERLVRFATFLRGASPFFDVIFTQDFHVPNDKELSDSPDLKKTFPEHCISGTWGAGIIDPVWEVFNNLPVCNIPLWMRLVPDLVSWDLPSDAEVFNIQKNAFSVFEGNPEADLFFLKLRPSIIFVCGVAGNVCVDFAIKGLLHRNYKVYFIPEVIKSLPGSDDVMLYLEWEELGACRTDIPTIVRSFNFRDSNPDFIERIVNG